MCFSPQASFISSAALAVIGVKTVRKTRKRAQYPLAVIPLFFALQQFAEGIVWLTFLTTFPELVRTIAIYVFLALAYIVWPIWLPISTYVLERNKGRKIMIGIMLLIGLCVGGYLLNSLITYPVQAKLFHQHISYYVGISNFTFNWLTIFYLTATILPMFLSSIHYLWVFGIGTSIAYLISYYFYYQCITSTWCFFAAILSIMIYKIIDKTNY